MDHGCLGRHRAGRGPVWPPEDLALDRVPEERLRSTVETNLLGSLFTARAFFHVLRRTGPRKDGQGASLVLIGSTAGRFGERGHADYAASKAGLVGACLFLASPTLASHVTGQVITLAGGMEGRLLWREEEVDRLQVLARLQRD